jgi:hypothetical protein
VSSTQLPRTIHRKAGHVIAAVRADAEASVAAPSLDALYAAQDAALRAWEGCAHGREVQCEHRIGFDVAWRALGDALESQAKAQEGP